MSIGPSNVFAIAPELTNGLPQTQKINFSVPLIVDNLITGTIAGFSFSVPFNTDNATTLNDLAAALAIFPVVGSASSNGTDAVTVAGSRNGITLPLVVTVTGGEDDPNVIISTTQYAVPGVTTLAQVNNAINLAAQMMGGPVTQPSHPAGSSTVTAMNSLTIGPSKENFVNGTSTINAIYTQGWTPGASSRVTLIFTAGATIKNNTAGLPGTAPILLDGGADLVASPNTVLGLEWDGTYWQQTYLKRGA